MKKFGFKKITTDNWLQADEVMNIFKKINSKGEFENSTAMDWIEVILEPQLNESVPENIHKLFEISRGAMVYGYLFYPLYTFGMEQLPRISETAIIEKCKSLGCPNSLKSYTQKLNWLKAKGYFSETDIKRWDSIRKIRNKLSHPENAMIITPVMTINFLNSVTKAINKLFE